MLLFSIILAAAVVLFASRWIAIEATAALVVGSLALTGVLSPAEALSGFANPATITI